MSTPPLPVQRQTAIQQFSDCLKVNDDTFFSEKAVSNRTEAIRSLLVLRQEDKDQLFYRLTAFVHIQISRADFYQLNDTRKLSFLSGWLSTLPRESLRDFFRLQANL